VTKGARVLRGHSITRRRVLPGSSVELACSCGWRAIAGHPSAVHHPVSLHLDEAVTAGAVETMGHEPGGHRPEPLTTERAYMPD